MQTILFCRVSSKDQESTGYSLPAQEKFLTEYALRKGLTIKKVFYISESARGKKERQIFNEMFTYINKNKIPCIVCEKVDRYTRNFKDSIRLYDWLETDENRQIHSVKDSLILSKNARSQEKFNWDIKVVMAKNYSDNLSEEVRKGHREKAEQGWLPSKPPVGYKTIDLNGHRIHVVNEEKSPFVKKAFELYSTGNFSLQKLTTLLYNEGFRSNNGNKVPKSKIHKLLTEPFYYGYFNWKGSLWKGKHEPIISPILFEEVQNRLVAKNTPKYSHHKHIFKGLIKCKECGGTISWETHKGIKYGHCNHFRNCTQKKWAKEEDVEMQVRIALEKLQLTSNSIKEWIRDVLKDSHEDEILYHQTAISELTEMVNRIQKRLDNLYEDKLDEVITKETYDSKFKQFTSEKNNALAKIEAHQKANTRYYELGVKIFDLSQSAIDLYNKAKTIENKHTIIQFIFTEMYIADGTFSYKYSIPFDIIFNAVKQTNSSKLEEFVKNQEENFVPLKGSQVKEKSLQLEKMKVKLGSRDSNPKFWDQNPT